jgi:hypothetical protein
VSFELRAARGKKLLVTGASKNINIPSHSSKLTAQNLKQFPNLLMKCLFSVLFFCLLALSFSCDDDSEPEYSAEPFISLKDITFTKIESEVDKLSLTINFRDGDKDLGLESTDTNTPFNPRTYFTLSGNSLTPVPQIEYSFVNNDEQTFLRFGEGQTGKLVTLTSDVESLPPNIYPYSCQHYIPSSLYIEKADASFIPPSSEILEEHTFNNKEYYKIRDTFYSEANINYFNIFVEFLYKAPDEDAFKVLDWKTITQVECGPGFDDRIPRTYNLTSSTVESGPFFITMKSPYEGEIEYNMRSEGFPIVFGIQKLKLRIHIKDRALHDSNVIETNEFTLEEILKSE